MKLEDLMKMKLHELQPLKFGGSVRRVPGGWIYHERFERNEGAAEIWTSVFVPEPKAANHGA